MIEIAKKEQTSINVNGWRVFKNNWVHGYNNNNNLIWIFEDMPHIIEGEHNNIGMQCCKDLDESIKIFTVNDKVQNSSIKDFFFISPL